MSCQLIPEAVRNCCEVLRRAGYAAHLVGGCVRDCLLGHEPKDWDVTTSARPEQIQALFEHTIPTGVRHGTVTVIESNMVIEVTTFRRESSYTDSRHPDSVTFDTDLNGDLARRDFTINAMAFAENGDVIAPFGGQKDLKEGVIRAVGDPAVRFSEDALRILRAVRFAAQLDFTIERETAIAMEKYAPMVDHVAAERVKTEMEKILLSERPEWISELIRLGVLNRFYDGWTQCRWNMLSCVEPVPVKRWKVFCDLTGFPIERLPIERVVRMAVLRPERECVKNLSLSGGEIQRLGYTGQGIGAAQRRLAAHIQVHPEDNTPERLKEILKKFDTGERVECHEAGH